METEVDVELEHALACLVKFSESARERWTTSPAQSAAADQQVAGVRENLILRGFDLDDPLVKRTAVLTLAFTLGTLLAFHTANGEVMCPGEMVILPAVTACFLESLGGMA